MKTSRHFTHEVDGATYLVAVSVHGHPENDPCYYTAEWICPQTGKQGKLDRPLLDYEIEDSAREEIERQHGPLKTTNPK